MDDTSGAAVIVVAGKGAAYLRRGAHVYAVGQVDWGPERFEVALVCAVDVAEGYIDGDEEQFLHWWVVEVVEG